MSSLKRVLVVGLREAPASADAAKHKEAGTPAELRAKIEAQTRAAQEAGFDLDVMFLAPQKFEAALEEIKNKFRSESYDGFLIGNGVRQTPEYTCFFEDLVNASREMAPKVKMAFNTKPSDVLTTLQRSFG